MGQQCLYADNLPEIPSEFIEPYAKRYMMMQLETLYYGMNDVKAVKERLSHVMCFLCAFVGIHAEMAISNEYYRIINMNDEKLMQIVTETFD